MQEEWYPPQIKDKVEREKWHRLKYDSEYPLYMVFQNRFGEKLVYDQANDGIAMEIAPSWVFTLASKLIESGLDYDKAISVASNSFQKYKTDILFKEMVERNRLDDLFGTNWYN